MRNYILQEIQQGLAYRNDEGQPQYTISVGFLFAHEITAIEALDMAVKPITNSYNMIVLNHFKK